MATSAPFLPLLSHQGINKGSGETQNKMARPTTFIPNNKTDVSKTRLDQVNAQAVRAIDVNIIDSVAEQKRECAEASK